MSAGLRPISRRRLLIAAAGAAGAGVAASPWSPSALAATDDDLAYANFGLASSYLLADFYDRALRSGRLGASSRPTLRRGRAASNLHARTLTDLLTGASDTPATADDFAFEWPASSHATASAIRRTGLTLLGAVQGAYQSAAATLGEASYRVLFASLAASVAEQTGALAVPGGVEPFPAAIDLETASAALEGYLG